MKINSFGKHKSWWLAGFALVIALPLSLSWIYDFRSSQNSVTVASSPDSDIVVSPDAVAALGFLEPEGEVIHLSGTVLAEGARVDKLLVKQGERVKAGQIVALLDSHDRLSAALKRAQTQVKIARARLEQVKAGAKTGEINAQRARIGNLQAELQGQKDAQQATLERLEADFKGNAAAQQATLNQIAEVRDVDVVLAQAELEDAIVGVQQAQAELDLAYVRSPSVGQILKIHTRPGEIVRDRGIIELGQTEQMYVKAEVYETDISKVRLGQRSSITSDSFPGKLKGIVSEIGLQIGKKEVFSTNPVVDVDSRVVEVKIRLDSEDSQKVTGLTNLQVKVIIDSDNE